MFFRKKKDKTTKKIDKLITWLIIGWAVAWIIGLSKTNKWKKITNVLEKESINIFQKSHNLFGKTIVGVLKLFNKK